MSKHFKKNNIFFSKILLCIICLSALAYSEILHAQQTSRETEQIKKDLNARIEAAERALSIDSNRTLEQIAQDEKESEEHRQRIAKRTAEVQKELKVFLDELQNMRYDKRFHELGFSENNKASSSWEKRLETYGDSIENDDDVYILVKAVPNTLLSLGYEWMRHKGQMSKNAEWKLSDVQEALKWTLEEDE